MGRDREIVDDLKRKARICILHQPTMSGHHQTDCSPMMELQASPESSGRWAEGEKAPGWWFHRFETVWGPFLHRLCRQRNVTLFEFERAASQVPGLTPIEKTIVVSAFRQQQVQRLASSHNTSICRSERSLSAV